MIKIPPNLVQNITPFLSKMGRISFSLDTRLGIYLYDQLESEVDNQRNGEGVFQDHVSFMILLFRLEGAFVVELVQVPRIGIVKVRKRQEDWGAQSIAGVAVGNVVDTRGKVVLVAPVIFIHAGVCESSMIKAVLCPQETDLLMVYSVNSLKLQCPVKENGP